MTRRFKAKSDGLEHVYEVWWDKKGQERTLEPWSSLNEACKLWYKSQGGDKERIYYEEEERVNKSVKKSRRPYKQRGANNKAKAARGNPIKSVKNRKAENRKNRKPRAPAEAKTPSNPVPEKPKDTLALQQQLAQLDADFDREMKEAEVEFLQPPSFDDISRGTSRFRELTSEPHCAQSICAVCDEQRWQRDMKTYALAKDSTFPTIPAEVAATMQSELSAQNVEEKNSKVKLSSNKLKLLNGGEWRTEKAFKKYEDCILSSAGIDASQGLINICDKCHHPLSKGVMPQAALANNLCHGERPKELQGLTWLEEQLIAIHRVGIFVVNLQGNDQVDELKSARLDEKKAVLAVKPNHRKVCKIKGNSVVMTHHAPKILTTLPPPAKELSEIVKVVFTKADGELPDKLDMRKIFGVRRSKVIAALQWLKRYNPEWANVNISADNASDYDDASDSFDGETKSCIVQPFWDSIVTSKDVDAAAENVGVAPGQDSDDNDETIHFRGIIDTTARTQSVEEVVKNAHKRLQDSDEQISNDKEEKKQKILNVPEGNMQSTYRNPRMFLGAFPVLFPFGVGGPQCDRAKRMSLETFAKHAMLTSDGRFRDHGVFMFFLFNVIQIHRVNAYAGTSMRLRRFLDFSKHRTLLTSENLHEAFKHLSAVHNKGGRPKLSHIRNPGLRKALDELFKEFGTITKQMPLTDSAKMQARYELHALQARYGIMDLFVTVNPNDKHAPLMCKLAGQKIKIGLEDPDVPDRARLVSKDPGSIKWPSGNARAQLLAEKPLAAAQYAHIVMQAFFKALVGFDPETGQRKGVFGRVAYYHFNSEEQGRGSLHFHGGIGLASHLSRQELMQKLKEPEFQQRVVRYLNNMILQQPPALCTSGPFVEHKYQPDELKRQEIKCSTKLHDGSICGKTHFDGSQCMAWPKKDRLKDDHIAFGRVPEAGDNEQAFWQRTGAFLDKLIPAEQTHVHTHTRACVHWKDKRKRALNKKGKMKPDHFYAEWLDPDFKCRFGYGRELVPATHITTGGNIVLERQHHWTNNYHPILAACLRTNHDIQVTWGKDQQGVAMYMTNYATKQQKHLYNKLPMLKLAAEKWEALEKQGKRSKAPVAAATAPQPASQPAAPAAADESKTATPMDTSESASVAAADPKPATPMDTSENDDEKKKQTPISEDEMTNKSFIAKMFNKIQGDTELSAHTVVAHLVGLPDRYSSHEYQTLLLTEFLNWAETSDVARHYISADREARTSNEGEVYKIRRSKNKKLGADNLRMHYYHRPSGLEQCCLYDFVASAEVKELPKSPTAQKNESESEEDNEETKEAESNRSSKIYRFIRDSNGAAHSYESSCGLTFTPGKFVPVVRVKHLPSRHLQPERFAKLILLRFKPFRAIEDLRPTGTTWEEALREFEDNCSPRVKRLIANLEAIRDAENARAEDFHQQEEDLQKSIKGKKLREPGEKKGDDGGSDSDRDDDNDDDGDEDMEHEGSPFADLKFRPTKDEGGIMALAVKNVADMGAYMEGKQAARGAGALKDGTEAVQDEIAFARTELKKRLQAAKDGELHKLLNSKFSESKQGDPADPRMETLPGATATADIEREFTLNRKQRFAFRIIVKHLQEELTNSGRAEEDQTDVEQLRVRFSLVYSCFK